MKRTQENANHELYPCTGAYLTGWLAGLSLLACLLASSIAATRAQAQIAMSGRHPHYHVELEPHLVWQWTGDEAALDDGVGFGFRASIPLLQDGPVPTINNSLAISFGIDWAWFGDCRAYGGDCSENDFWVPITVQWNFFLTSVVSLFPEFGLGFRDAVFDYDVACNPRSCRGSSLEVHPVLWFGARFYLAPSFAIVVRLGTPSLQLGASFSI